MSVAAIARRKDDAVADDPCFSYSSAVDESLQGLKLALISVKCRFARGELRNDGNGTSLAFRCKGGTMKYGVAWLLGVPFSLIVLWFLANQMGCGL